MSPTGDLLVTLIFVWEGVLLSLACNVVWVIFEAGEPIEIPY